MARRADGHSDRGLLERDAVSLLSTRAGSNESSSANWLGHHVYAAKVRESSLWNVNHVDDPFDDGALEVLQEYVRATPRTA